MHEFERDCILKEYARALAQSEDELSQIGRELVEADSDERGTIASLGREFDEIADDGKSAILYEFNSDIYSSYTRVCRTSELYCHSEISC